MQTLKIEVEDDIVHKIMWLLQNIKGVQVKTFSEKDNNYLVNSSVNTIQDWQDKNEDEIWK